MQKYFCVVTIDYYETKYIVNSGIQNIACMPMEQFCYRALDEKLLDTGCVTCNLYSNTFFSRCQLIDNSIDI